MLGSAEQARRRDDGIGMKIEWRVLRAFSARHRVADRADGEFDGERKTKRAGAAGRIVVGTCGGRSGQIPLLRWEGGGMAAVMRVVIGRRLDCRHGLRVMADRPAMAGHAAMGHRRHLDDGGDDHQQGRHGGRPSAPRAAVPEPDHKTDHNQAGVGGRSQIGNAVLQKGSKAT